MASPPRSSGSDLIASSITIPHRGHALGPVVITQKGRFNRMIRVPLNTSEFDPICLNSF